MRDLMFLGAMFVLVPLALSNAYVAMLIWAWTGLIAIDNYLYGFMEAIRLNLIFALITLMLLLTKRDPERAVWQWNPSTAILVALVIHVTLSATFGYSGNRENWMLYERFVKIAIFAILMPLAVNSRYRIHAFVVVIALGMGFHGLIDGLKFLSSGGGHIVRGFRKFGDNNHFAVMLAMAIPLMLYLARYANSRILRLGAVFATVITIAAVIGTRSRGGFVALAAAGLWYLITSRQRMAGLVVVVAGAVLVLNFAPASWTERMQTIKEADQDSSFMSRVEAWQVSSAIAMHNPLLGGGLHAVQVQSVWERFRGNRGILPFVDTGRPSEIFRAAHSIYFETMGDLGFVGFGLFMALILRALYVGLTIGGKARMLGPDWEWAVDLGRALASVIVVFMVGGLTVSIAYSELIYMVVVLAELLRTQVDRARASMPAPSDKRSAVNRMVHR